MRTGSPARVMGELTPTTSVTFSNEPDARVMGPQPFGGHPMPVRGRSATTWDSRPTVSGVGPGFGAIGVLGATTQAISCHVTVG
ncbi:hypothetical protein GCM10023170_072120 [Phytohabitans houttuyneae]|uniref:Uncharacterized protein n=1 Tax=Phytohabitans houttuyneae TaxID=1076126 RepID=A0A6V8KAS2_9ACTN|nr:hypothetical protein Phou_050440 [Phytohabitans houttuyneae]